MLKPTKLRIFETRYVDMVRQCMREGSNFGVLLIREGAETGPASTVDVGTTAQIMDFHQLSDGLLGLSCVGRQRFRVERRQLQSDGLNLADVILLEAEPKLAVPPRHAYGHGSGPAQPISARHPARDFADDFDDGCRWAHAHAHEPHGSHR